MPDLYGYNIPTWACVVTPLVIVGYNYLTWNFGYFKKRGVPHPKPYPLIGSGASILKKGLIKFDEDTRKEYGKLVGLFNGRKPMYLVYDLDMLKEILVKEFSHFQNHQIAGILQYPTRKLITQLQFDHWKHVRNTLTPTFSGGKLRRMAGGVNRSCQTLIGHLEKKAEQSEVIDLKTLWGNFTMDVIASSAFGIDVDSQKEGDNNEFARMGRKISNQFETLLDPKIILIVFFPWVFKYTNMSIFPKDSLNFFLSVINQSLKNRGSDEKNAKDFLQLMVNAHIDDPKESDMSTDSSLKKSEEGFIYSERGLTHEEILAQALIFFLAGFDTTAGTISFLSYNLACHPEKQDKLYQEIAEVMEGKSQPDYDIIKKMPYLQMCIEESLRMYPIAPRTDRVCNEEIVINGVKFEKGMTVGIPIWSIHHDPDIWPDPDNFIPERFSPEEKATHHPMAWLPFGQGPRNCIGMRLALMEIKFAMVQLLLHFRLVTCEETQIPLVLHKLRMDGEKGIKIKVEKR